MGARAAMAIVHPSLSTLWVGRQRWWRSASTLARLVVIQSRGVSQVGLGFGA